MVMRVNVDDMPPPAVEALLQFVYTGTYAACHGRRDRRGRLC